MLYIYMYIYHVLYIIYHISSLYIHYEILHIYDIHICICICIYVYMYICIYIHTSYIVYGVLRSGPGAVGSTAALSQHLLILARGRGCEVRSPYPEPRSLQACLSRWDMGYIRNISWIEYGPYEEYSMAHSKIIFHLLQDGCKPGSSGGLRIFLWVS